MTSSRMGPEYVLRLYAWQLLKKNIMIDKPGGAVPIDESQYGGIIPIVPLTEQPEVQNYGTHIVYGFNFNPSPNVPARKQGTMTFVIFEKDFRLLGEIITVLQHAFERNDESAREVNAWSSYYPEFSSNSKPFVGIRFGNIGINYVEGGTPEDQEGGDQSGVVSIEFEYYADYDVVIPTINPDW